jgi:hypothetical protein
LTLPSGYRGPLDPTRDQAQVMSDGVAQNLIADICQLHEDLLAKLDHDIELAVGGQAEPASGFVTGSRERDQMASATAAIRRAEHERDRGRKNALQRLRDVKEYYREQLGLRPLRRPPVQSIDYQTDGQRRVG